MNPSEAYATQVVKQLRDLDSKTRQHLFTELAAELGQYPEADDQAALAARLGSPEDYALTLGSEMRLKTRLPRRTVVRRGVGIVASVLPLVTLLLVLENPIGPGHFYNYGEFELIGSPGPFSDYQGVAFEYGRRGTIHLSLANRGRFSLDLFDVDVFPARPRAERDTSFYAGPLVQEGVLFQLYRESAGGPIGRYADAIELRPGDLVSVAVSVSMTNCDTNAVGSSAGYSHALVTFSYLGFTRTAEVPIPGIYTTIPDPCRGSS